MSGEGERRKDVRETLDAALSGARDRVSEELLVDAVRRVLAADAVEFDEIVKWIRTHE